MKNRVVIRATYRVGEERAIRRSEVVTNGVGDAEGFTVPEVTSVSPVLVLVG